MPQKVQERILETTNEYGELEQSASSRLSIWAVSWEVFQKNPVTGIGWGVFRRLGYDLGDTHNIYLKILVEQGVLGLTIFLILCLCFLREGMNLYAKGDDDLSKGLGLGLAVATIVMVFNNLFGDRWTYFELSSYLWIYAGLVSRLRIIAQEETKKGLTKVKGNKKSKLKFS